MNREPTWSRRAARDLFAQSCSTLGGAMFAFDGLFGPSPTPVPTPAPTPAPTPQPSKPPRKWRVLRCAALVRDGGGLPNASALCTPPRATRRVHRRPRPPSTRPPSQAPLHRQSWRHGGGRHGAVAGEHLYTQLVATAFAAAAVGLSLCHVFRTCGATCTRPRKYIVRVLLLVPLYAVDACLGLKAAPRGSCQLLRECYEAFALFSFVQFLLPYLGGRWHRKTARTGTAFDDAPVALLRASCARRCSAPFNTWCCAAC